MFKNLFPKSIRLKIMTITAAVTLAITAITVMVCYKTFQSFLRKAEIQSAEFNLQVVSNNVSADMENILSFNQWCGSNTSISHFLESFKDVNRMPSISSKDYALRAVALNTYERLKEEYYNTHSADYMARVIVSPANHRNYLQITDTYASSSSTVTDMLYEQDFFHELLSAPGYVWDGLKPDPLLISDEPLFLPIVRPIYSQYNTDMIGWTYITVSDRLIADYLKAFPLEEDSSLFITIGSHTYQYLNGEFTESGNGLSKVSQLEGQTFNEQTSAYTVRFPDGSLRTAVTCPLGSLGWTITHVLSENTYTAQRQVYTFIIAGIVFFIGLTGMLLYLLLNRMIGGPVQKLQGKIQEISQGDFRNDPSIEWPDEFGNIGRGINRMAENVVSLMDKKVEDEKQKKDLEYQILQSQINPHFLYNTLNSIKWMATIQGASGIVEMTTALARLMKNVAKGTAARIPLREELDLVKDYFLIQQYRYGGSITIEYQIEDETLLDCLIHRFTLQPIVENALFHGIEPKGCAGRVVIRAEEQISSDGSRQLYITVTDNGIGMSQEIIEKVLRNDTASSADFFRQIGISNVNRRIQYDYGESYGITIESVPGSYTTMKITLPYRTVRGEENDETTDRRR